MKESQERNLKKKNISLHRLVNDPLRWLKGRRLKFFLVYTVSVLLHCSSMSLLGVLRQRSERKECNDAREIAALFFIRLCNSFAFLRVTLQPFLWGIQISVGVRSATIITQNKAVTILTLLIACANLCTTLIQLIHNHY